MAPSNTWKLSALVLAGGASRRMGRDKARLMVRGRPLIAHIVTRLQSVAQEVLVVSRWPHTYAFVGVACVPDVLPGEGPLAGLWSGALVAAGRYVAPVACDMPFVNPALLAAMVEALEGDAGLEGIVPIQDQQEHPLHGVYRRDAVLRAGARALREGHRALRALWAHMNVARWRRDRWQEWDPDGRAFWNLNTPEDWKRLLDWMQDAPSEMA